MIKDKVFNKTIINGNKFMSERLVYRSLKKIQKKMKLKNFEELFKVALINSAPIFYIKTIKRKRKNSVEFPFMLPKKLRVSYGLKFIINYSNTSKKIPFHERLTKELLDSCVKASKSFKKKETLCKESFTKKKFSNYRWF